MNGRELLNYLQTLNEKELAFPIVAAIPIADGENEEDVYPSGNASLLPNGLIGIHVPDARVSRRIPPTLPSTNGADMESVESDDLRAVWKIMRDTNNKQGSFEYRSLERVCYPGANLNATWFRAAMLSTVQTMTDALGRWTHNGELDERVFEVAARFPMKKMEIGVAQKGLPFNIEEFVERIEAEKGENGNVDR
jgi:hypothetical protein